MNKYEIYIERNMFEIEADDWQVSPEGLKFYVNKKIIAWFTSFDCWICKGEFE